MATICKAIEVVVAGEAGQVAEMAEKIRDTGVNIQAFFAWTEGGRGKVVAITDNCEKVRAAVSDGADSCAVEEALLATVKNQPGALGEIARKLADAGIRINMVCGTPGHAPTATFVLYTSDNARAAELV
jgi:hypothetical protein